MNCYIHVPFCLSKCGYCAFYSEAGMPSQTVDAYLEHLAEDIIPAELSTLYVGGGTPTSLDEWRLQRLVEILREKFILLPDAECSIEANPETLTEKKVEILRSNFTRISLGIQSFNGTLRKKIGRRCSDAALNRAIDMIKAADFPHWNGDLIYSLPDESLEEWKQDLVKIAGCGVDHVSCYSLTPERSAVLGETFAVDDEREKVMYDMAAQVLADYGINRYEISNYASASCECRHNLNVWRGGLLCGYGPGAAGFDGKDRHIEVESLSLWLDGEAPETDHIPSTQRLNEIFAVNLRTVAGWNPDMWSAVPGADSWENRLDSASELAEKFPGCVDVSHSYIRLTDFGLLFWNDIAAEIL